ncbi:MAG: hypothetical protein ABL993_05220 [Vicinamibacterales bacterium]
MPKCRVAKGGWSWQGEAMVVGAVILAPSEQWIDNRINDGGLVERIDATPAADVIEQAVREPEAESAVAPRQRRTKK